MLKQLIQKLLRHRHPWRDIDFDELSEIYVTMLLRSAAISMTGIFVPVYLYKLNYSVTAICSVYALYFTTRIFVDFLAAYTTAKIGPKHTLVIGQILQIVSSGMFLTISATHISPGLAGAIWGASSSFFFIPFHVDFSKVKHKLHGGKELSYEQIMEKIGFVIGPLIAGIVATVVGSKFIFLVSIILLVGGLWPLFRTKEPTRINQKLNFGNLDVGHIKRYIPSYLGLNIENTLCLMLWPLFLTVFVLPGNTVYLKVGIISSVSVFASIISVHAIGKLVDKSRGKTLLRYSATLNALVHFYRPFVTLFPVAFIINLVNEGITNGYRLPYTKGFYDTADDFPGHRIVFITSMEALGCVAKSLVWWILTITSTLLIGRSVFYIGFFIAGFASLMIMTEKFKALNG